MLILYGGFNNAKKKKFIEVLPLQNQQSEAICCKHNKPVSPHSGLSPLKNRSGRLPSTILFISQTDRTALAEIGEQDNSE